jgi:hypothetical protein
MRAITNQAIVLPRGRYKDRPPSEAPTGYLLWYVSTLKMSSGVQCAIEAELLTRGVEMPPAPPPRQPSCSRCGPSAPVAYRLFLDRLQRQHIRATCGWCGASLGNVPRVEPFLSLATPAERGP